MTIKQKTLKLFQAKDYQGVLRTNLRLAYKLASRYQKHSTQLGIDFEDIKQEAVICLWDTIHKWEPERGSLGNLYHLNANKWLMRYINRAEHYNVVTYTYRPEKKNWKKDSPHYPVALESIQSTPCPSFSPESPILIDKAIDRVLVLTDDWNRVAAFLGRLEGYTAIELSQELGLSRRAVYDHWEKTEEMLRIDFQDKTLDRGYSEAVRYKAGGVR